MPSKIYLLPNHIANKIAAGEVIQAPSFVVKELLANAVDAQSKNIKVIIKKAGSTLIQVIDDGYGMNEVDARMCFERHATSKIKQAKDLDRIQTLGFRGEALASIAAVAQVTLTTKETQQELGTQITLSASTIHKQTPTNTPTGTNIAVKNLFFNVPARRNFLKSPNIETKHIIEEVQHIALAHPKIAISLYQDDINTYQLPSQKLPNRIIHLFGKPYQNKLLPCQTSTELIQIHGYIGTPKEAKKTRGEQFFFVNNRHIKSTYLNHAVKKAFEGLLPPNTFPFYILYITIPPHHIDVNIHPAKTEIKFQEESLIYGMVTTAVKKALATHHITPSLNLEQTENFQKLFTPQTHTTYTPISKQEKAYSLFNTPTTKETFKATDQHSLQQKQNEVVSQINKISPIQKNNINKLQLHKKYLIAQVKSGMLVINQHAAHERITYEKVLGTSKKTNNATQHLLSPIQINLQPPDIALIQNCKKEIQILGFQFTIKQPTTIIFTGLPPNTQNHNLQKLFEELLEQYKSYKQKLSIPQKEKWARSIAKRIYLNNTLLSHVEIEAIIEKLFSCQNPNYTPDGKPIWTILTLDQLEDLFTKK